MEIDSEKVIGWTQSQQQLFFKIHRQVGNKWSIISGRMGGRSDNSLKNKYYSTIRKGFRKLNNYISNVKRKLCPNPYSPPKLIKQEFLNKLSALADRNFQQKYQARPSAIQASSQIQSQLIELALSRQNTSKNAGPIQSSFQQQLLLKIQQFNRNCKKRKGKRKSKSATKIPHVDQYSEEEEQNQQQDEHIDNILLVPSPTYPFLKNIEKQQIKTQKIINPQKQYKQSIFENKKLFESNRFNIQNIIEPIAQQSQEIKQEIFQIRFFKQQKQFDLLKSLDIVQKSQTPTYFKSIPKSVKSCKFLMQQSPVALNNQSFASTMSNFQRRMSQSKDFDLSQFQKKQIITQNINLHENYPMSQPLISPFSNYPSSMSMQFKINPTPNVVQCLPVQISRMKSQPITFATGLFYKHDNTQHKPDISLVTSQLLQGESDIVPNLFRSQAYPPLKKTMNPNIQ